MGAARRRLRMTAKIGGSHRLPWILLYGIGVARGGLFVLPGSAHAGSRRLCLLSFTALQHLQRAANASDSCMRVHHTQWRLDSKKK